MKPSVDERLKNIEIVLNNGLRDGVAHMTKDVSALKTSVTKLEKEQSASSQKMADFEKRVSNHFKLIYERLDRLLVKSEQKSFLKLPQKFIAIGFFTIVGLSVVSYAVKLFNPEAPDMSLFTFLLDFVKAITK